MEHKWEVKYDPYNYNNGVPPEPGLYWQNGSWNWENGEETLTVTAIPIPGWMKKSKNVWPIIFVLSAERKIAHI